MSDGYVRVRYTAANLQALRADIRAAVHACVRDRADCYYPRDSSADVRELRARLHELRDPIPESHDLRHAVHDRVNRRRHLDKLGLTARAKSFQCRTIELMRAGNVWAMYLED